MENQLQDFMNSNFGSQLSGMIGPGLLRALSALLIFLITWMVAKFVSGLITKLVKKAPFDERMGEKGNTKPSKLIGKLVHYLLLIMGSLIALEILGVSNVLEPLKDMLSKFMQSVPNIIGAGVIGIIGYYLAQFVSELVSMAGDFINKYSEKLNLGNLDLGNILKKIVFVIVFVPILMVALDYLQMTVITDPAKVLFTNLLSAIPKIILAVIIMAVFYIVGKYVVQLLEGILENIGINEYAVKYNMTSITGERKLSSVIGSVATFMILLIGATTAVGELEFAALTNILNEVLALASKVLFGLLILLLGNFLANTAYKFINKSDDNVLVANIAKYVILALFIAISLRQMGIANEIIELAFGLTLGAIAVAFALMFGLGGREAAGEQVREFFKKFKK
ncbi:mechanosensitive ion channel [uncultured Arcticibacterium sp.]|uniref:mechanosensitive ion channel n=1 Tax=uncultured Arcticibacterium sp. TaxID=2173042 RepID=UPI0030F7A1AF